MARPDARLRDGILEYLRRVYPGLWRQWFERIEPVDLNGGRLLMLVNEPVRLRYLQNQCVPQFTEAAQAVLGYLVVVQFVATDELAEHLPQNERTGRTTTDGGRPGANNAPASTRNPGRGATTGYFDDEMVLSPDYSFENFVVWPGNQLAHAIAIGIAQRPGETYNPFFLHSGVGLGKTHLLQAICQDTLARHPSVRMHYVSCESFKTQFFDAVKEGEMAEFRHRFRDIDMLLIDDIHDLAQYPRVQEEFFHTFNTLYQSKKQIVLSSDAPPNEIPDLEERLVSRFNSGLIAHIERPAFETRVEIVNRKAQLLNLDISRDVASYIAGRIDSNIRELEGALKTIQGHAMAHQQAVNLDVAKQALGEHGAHGRRGQVSVQDIIDTVTEYYGVRLTELLSKKRTKSVAQPRQVSMWLARKLTRHSLQEIGGYFGGRDHTTVMHAIRTIDQRRGLDTLLEQDLERLEDRLRRALDHAASTTTDTAETHA